MNKTRISYIFLNKLDTSLKNILFNINIYVNLEKNPNHLEVRRLRLANKPRPINTWSNIRPTLEAGQVVAKEIGLLSRAFDYKAVYI